MKKILAVALTFLMLLTVLCVSACNGSVDDMKTSGPHDGVYYSLNGSGSGIDESSWIKIKGNFWSDDEGSEGKIVFNTDEEIEFFLGSIKFGTGTLVDGLLTVDTFGSRLQYKRTTADNSADHKHSFATEWTTDRTHHWREATCGHTDQKKFYDEHEYSSEDYLCTSCGLEYVPLGLNYTKSSNGNYYIVKKDSSTTLEAEVVIAETYKGIPITQIYKEVFWGNKKLKKITLSKNITSLGSNAFSNCTNLELVVYQGTVSEWKSLLKSSYGSTFVFGYHVQCSDGEIGADGLVVDI